MPRVNGKKKKPKQLAQFKSLKQALERLSKIGTEEGGERKRMGEWLDEI